MVNIGIALVFTYTAYFQLWVFWQLWLHQEIVLQEPSKLINNLEFGLAMFIFCFALFFLGVFTIKLIKGVKND